MQRDGKIVAAGIIYLDDLGLNSGVALARYDSDGSLDTSFGSGGKVTTDFSPSYDIASAIVVQPDAKIVVGGNTVSTNGDLDFFLLRYQADGEIDTDFGLDGTVVTTFSAFNDYVSEMILQSDGKL